MTRMTDRSGRWGVVIAMTLCGVGMLAGCADPPSRLNAPPQGASQRPHELQDQYTYMHDNAMLAEMSISPAHFVPGRSDINALGLRRLMRYADLLREYGGTLHYDGVEDPEPLARDRMDRVRAFLASAGVDPGSFNVERGLAGGAGMRGEEAGRVRDFSDFSAEGAHEQGKGGKWDNASGR